MFQGPVFINAVPVYGLYPMPTANMEVIKMTGLNATRYAKCGLAAAAAMTAVSGASAAAISWGSVSVFDDATDVDNSGTVVAAVSAASTPAVTVNGVAFTADTGDLTTAGFAGGNNNYGSGFFAGSTTGDADYLNFTGGQAWYNGASSATITLSGLTIGQQYSFQYIIIDGRGPGNYQGRSAVLGDNSGGTASDPVFRTNGTDGDGNTVIGTFTADAATQDVTFAGDDVGITGYVLSEVPEPGSLALLGLGGLLIARRRRG